ncbi:MAG TPA: DoxX family protein [Fredinandcohnia sp.]|nr:DoxX family protein [Fredinandcohnia sp.]
MSKQARVDLGLLVLRIGLGAMFIVAHGLPKLLGGPDRWKAVGQAMSALGIHFAPLAWGLAAALSEFGGGILLVLGLFTRMTSLVMTFTMFVATAQHFAQGHTLLQASHSIEVGIALVALALMGAGAHSLDRRLGKA